MFLDRYKKKPSFRRRKHRLFRRTWNNSNVCPSMAKETSEEFFDQGINKFSIPCGNYVAVSSTLKVSKTRILSIQLVRNFKLCARCKLWRSHQIQRNLWNVLHFSGNPLFRSARKRSTSTSNSPCNSWHCCLNLREKWKSSQTRRKFLVINERWLQAKFYLSEPFLLMMRWSNANMCKWIHTDRIPPAVKTNPFDKNCVVRIFHDEKSTKLRPRVLKSQFCARDLAANENAPAQKVCMGSMHGRKRSEKSGLKRRDGIDQDAK